MSMMTYKDKIEILLFKVFITFIFNILVKVNYQQWPVYKKPPVAFNIRIYIDFKKEFGYHSKPLRL